MWTCISNVVCRGSLFKLRQDLIVRFVNIGGIVDHHCLNFLIITTTVINRISILLKLEVKGPGNCVSFSNIIVEVHVKELLLVFLTGN